MSKNNFSLSRKSSTTEKKRYGKMCVCILVIIYTSGKCSLISYLLSSISSLLLYFYQEHARYTNNLVAYFPVNTCLSDVINFYFFVKVIPGKITYVSRMISL